MVIGGSFSYGSLSDWPPVITFKGFLSLSMMNHSLFGFFMVWPTLLTIFLNSFQLSGGGDRPFDMLLPPMCFSRFIIAFPKTDFPFFGNGADFRVIKILAVVMIGQRTFWKVL